VKLVNLPAFYRVIAGRISTADVVTFGAVTAMAGGLMWMFSGALSGLLASGLLSGGSGFEVVAEAFSILALAGTMGGIASLHARQSYCYGFCGRLGFLAAFSGAAILLAGLPLSSIACVHAPATLDVILVAGFWGLAGGLFLLGVATLRLGFLPQWSGALLLVALPLAVAAGNLGGGLMFGASWIALGYTLLCRHDVSAIIRARGERM
jgi:hypothetical protein